MKLPRRTKDADKAEEAKTEADPTGDKGGYGSGVDQEPTLADDKRAGAVDPDTGEPKDNPVMFFAVLKNPGAFSPEDVGATIIKGLDQLALCMTAEVRTRQPELFQVFQLFTAERPSILERQKRLQLRQNQG